MILPTEEKIPQIKTLYICKFGILRWGLPLYALFLILATLTVNHRRALVPFNMTNVSLFALLACLGAGWILGAISWHRRQQSYKTSPMKKQDKV